MPLNALPSQASGLDRLGSIMTDVYDALEQKSQKASDGVKQQISWLEKLKKAVDDVGKSFTLLGQIVGAVSATSTAGILGMVRVAAPGAVMRFEQAWRSLVGVLGQMFVPIVRESVKWIREAATFLYNLSPTVKAAMAAFAIGAITAGIAIAGLTAGVWALNVALVAANTLTGGIAIVVGALVVVVAGLTAGLATAAVTLGKFGGAAKTSGVAQLGADAKTAADGAKDAAVGVAKLNDQSKAVKDAASGAADSLTKMGAAGRLVSQGSGAGVGQLADQSKAVKDAASGAADSLAKMGAAGKSLTFGDVISGVKAGLNVAWELVTKLAGAIQTALAPAIAYGQRVWAAFFDGLSGIGSALINYAAAASAAWQTFAERFASLLGITATWEDTVKAGVKLLGQGIVNLVSGVAALIEHFTKLTIILDRLGQVRSLQDVKQLVGKIKEDFAKFNALKAKNQEDFLNAANRKDQQAAPYFPNQVKLGGVAEAKHDFWIAALRASAQDRQDPQKQQMEAQTKNTTALEANSKLLDAWLKAYNHAPAAGMLGP